MYWNIKKIEVEKSERNDPKKFDKMINAIKASDDIKGYSKVLWTVGQQWCWWLWLFDDLWWLFQDPKKQQWKPRKSIKWNIRHSISNSEIRFIIIVVIIVVQLRECAIPLFWMAISRERKELSEFRWCQKINFCIFFWISSYILAMKRATRDPLARRSHRLLVL